MTTEEKIFFTLLRAGLNQTDCNLTIDDSITDDIWHDIYHISGSQGLQGVVFTAIEQLPKSQLPPKNLFLNWLGKVVYVANVNKEYRRNASDFLSKVRNTDLEVLILKGIECAKYYPEPNKRSLGDFDIICIDRAHNDIGEGYEDCNRLCKKIGLPVVLHDYKHSKIQYKSLAIENHRFCTEIRGEKVKKDFERHLQDLLLSSFKSQRVECFRVQFDALFLIAHAFNHFLDEGLSLRQICDWAMFVKAEQDKIDWRDFYHWMDRMHMRRFADALNAITVAELGVIIHNDAVVTSSVYKDIILHEALYGHKHLHSSNLHGLQYRMAQAKIAFSDRWKYRDICEQNVFIEYLKSVWFFFIESKPKLC